MEFSITGHPNILSTHRNTFEFTKEDYLTKSGDCIVGINSSFSIMDIKNEFGDQDKDILILIECENKKEEIKAIYNHTFNDEHEMVIRITDFKDGRTFATRADKSSKMLDRKLIELLQKGMQAKVTIKCI